MTEEYLIKKTERMLDLHPKVGDKWRSNFDGAVETVLSVEGRVVRTNHPLFWTPGSGYTLSWFLERYEYVG